jgi:hypothetical protein
MSNLKAEIKLESNQAAQFSQEALAAFSAGNFVQGKALMKKAFEAGRNCQNLIEQYNQTMIETKTLH